MRPPPMRTTGPFLTLHARLWLAVILAGAVVLAALFSGA